MHMGYLDYMKFGGRMVYKRGALPVYLVYFITDACNAKCKHCLLADGAHPGWEEPSMEYRRAELSLEELDKITASMGKSLMFLLPTGGEPFLRKDIGEIIKIFYKNTGVRNVGIPTNGSTTVRTIGIVRDLLDSCPDLDLGIDVSLDGVGALHDEIRVFPGLFQRAVTTYKELKALEKHYPRLNINVETTISKHNEDHLFENYDFFRRELQVDNIFTLLTRGSPKESSSKFFDVEKYETYAHQIEHDMKTGALTGYDSFPFADFINAKRIVRHRLIAKTVREHRYQTPCYAGNLGGALFANGDVYPCELLIDRKLGNVRDVDYDFRRVWFSPEAEAARRFIRDTKCFCTYECFLTVNILFNPRQMPGILKEWGSLKMRRLMRRLRGAPAPARAPLAAPPAGKSATAGA
jgi:MoaA/NifB/PqqE/SkfB family radical SAM enzyme